MPTLVYFGDDPHYSKLIEYFLRDATKDSFRFEVVCTADPHAAICQYQSTVVAAIVVVEYPQDAAATIQQLRGHPNFEAAILSVITSRYKQYQRLASETILIGDKTDILRMVQAALTQHQVTT